MQHRSFKLLFWVRLKTRREGAVGGGGGGCGCFVPVHIWREGALGEGNKLNVHTHLHVQEASQTHKRKHFRKIIFKNNKNINSLFCSKKIDTVKAGNFVSFSIQNILFLGNDQKYGFDVTWTRGVHLWGLNVGEYISGLNQHWGPQKLWFPRRQSYPPGG